MLCDPGPYPGGEGTGVVYVGGGKYWPGIAVGCRLLRELGCEWPVEVWYRGTCEAVDPADVAGLDVTFHDIDALSVEFKDNRIPAGDPHRGGWEAKGYALTHTQLRRVLYLDADAYCVSTPCRLTHLLDHHPFVFWSDLPNQQNSMRWEAVLPEVAAWGQVLPPVQGGQLLLDREHAWPLISVMHHICQHSEHYWAVPSDPARRLMYGDQDAWRIGLAAGSCGWRHLGPARWVSPAFVCEHEGKARFVHRCQAKLYRPEDADKGDRNQGQQFKHLPFEREVFRHFAEVMGRKPQDSAKAFGAIYAKELWSDSSGSGSTPAAAAPYLKILNQLIADRGWRSCIDVGCGDGRVAAGIAVERYTGVDVVPLFPGVIAADAYHDLESLPWADVLLAKDVLHHWPSAMVTDWLTRVRALLAVGRWRAVVITVDRLQTHDGADTHLGGYRALSLAMRPLAGFDLVGHAEYLHKAVLLMEHRGRG